ncbi:WD repeat-containing 52 [Brachionus plicatilis]|uniref:WD repeat-containing 52 n=1 Tax=Brachionus plicatilis TaxID=10195 RepID=A0A3M7T629_BRAPC|nr:WD repeat-containing 52 [Brachionus plicatilis]
MGEKNGVLRVSPMEESKKIEDMKHYWSFGYHDNDYGHVTNICLSYDEKFLFSIGADSNIFGILFNSSTEDLEKARKEKIRVECKSGVKEAVDIDDSSAYSIEQAKQKSEYDKMIAIAEGKKADMRQKINGLRKLFKDLTTKNDQLVSRLKLSRDEFMLEETIKEHVIKQINEKIDLTYRELAWQSEKCRLMLEKVQSKFKDAIDCDHVVVHSFDKSVNVSTFRTVALPKDMEAYKVELENQYLAKLLEKQKTKENLDAQVD